MGTFWDNTHFWTTTTCVVVATAAVGWVWLRQRKRLDEERMWRQALQERHFQGSRNENAGEIRVVSYNVLADGPKYCMNPNSLHVVPFDYLHASLRFRKIVEELKTYDPTVIGLQETQEHTLESYLRPAFGKDYTELHNERLEVKEIEQGTLFRSPFHRNTDCLFVRNREMEVLQKSIVQYHSIVESVFPEWSSDFTCMGDEDLWDELTRRFDGVSLVLARVRSTGKVACIANTHLYYNPRSPAVKTMQTYLLLQAAVNFCWEHGFHCEGSAKQGDQYPTIPLVIAGDFNALYRKPERDSFDVATEDEWNKGPPETRQSGTYNLLTKGVLSPNHQEHPFRRRARGLKEALSSPVGPMKSVYAEALGEELPMTTRVAIFEGTLDYIFVSPSVEVTRVLRMPYTTVNSEYGLNASSDFKCLPNEIWPSDHLAIGADLKFT